MRLKHDLKEYLNQLDWDISHYMSENNLMRLYNYDFTITFNGHRATLPFSAETMNTMLLALNYVTEIDG